MVSWCPGVAVPCRIGRLHTSGNRDSEMSRLLHTSSLRSGPGKTSIARKSLGVDASSTHPQQAAKCKHLAS
eukprot:9375401-Alexandrium_andersonii.AAC.1